MVRQKHILLPSYSRGFHLITEYILSEFDSLPSAGLLNIFIQHTSAGLTINENADPSVLVDFESYFNDIVDDEAPFITHKMEGKDDMPAHIKSTLTDSSITIPIVNGSLALGTWQGIYLCEFRDRPRRRNLIVTVYG